MPPSPSIPSTRYPETIVPSSSKAGGFYPGGRAPPAPLGSFLTNVAGRGPELYLTDPITYPQRAMSVGDPRIGSQIGAYSGYARLGEGGMGKVYTATGPDGGRVALKLVK